MSLENGKEIETKSFYGGKITKTTRSREESFLVNGTMGTLTTIAELLKQMPEAEDKKMTFEVIANKTNEPVRIVRRYQTERKTEA